MTLLDCLTVLSISFFIFEFYLFAEVRNYLRELNWFFKKLLNCPFCQGFWTGLFYHFIVYNNDRYFSFAFACAILNYAFVAFLTPYAEEMELRRKE